jgi:hypothetical protein
MSMRSRLVPGVLSGIVLLVLFPVSPDALSQIANGIFVTPVPNVPFVAVVKLEQTRTDPDGTIVNLKTNRAIARDSQGRIYKDSRRLQLATESNTPPMIMIDLYDPQTKTYTFIYPQYRTFWKGTLVRPPSLLAREFFYGWPTRNGLPVNESAKVEDLGTQTMEGMPVHGIRETQTIKDSAGKSTVATDEYWYSDDLRMNLVARHNQPGETTLTVTVTQVTRRDPDAALFEIPAGYKQNPTPYQDGVL